MLSPTNIWATGLVILEMASGGRIDAQLQKFYDDGPQEHAIPMWAEGNYSAALTGLIRRCVRYWPEERIGAEELREAIRKAMGGGGSEGCGEYMARAMEGVQESVLQGGERFGWTAGREMYRLDMVDMVDVDDDDAQVESGMRSGGGRDSDSDSSGGVAL
jgi:hypothetical protein